MILTKKWVMYSPVYMRYTKSIKKQEVMTYEASFDNY